MYKREKSIHGSTKSQWELQILGSIYSVQSETHRDREKPLVSCNSSLFLFWASLWNRAESVEWKSEKEPFNKSIYLYWNWCWDSIIRMCSMWIVSVCRSAFVSTEQKTVPHTTHKPNELFYYILLVRLIKIIALKAE